MERKHHVGGIMTAMTVGVFDTEGRFIGALEVEEPPVPELHLPTQRLHLRRFVARQTVRGQVNYYEQRD